MRRAAAAATVTAILLAAASALADVEVGPHDVATVFFVSKSDERNRVDYGIHLDDRCRAASDRPMFVYWRQYGSDGRQSMAGLNFLERPYDVARQDIVERGERGTVLVIEIGAFRARRITVRTSGSFGRCVATATMEVAGQEAMLDHVHLVLSGPSQLDHAVLYGRTEAGDVQEIVRR